ncbi:Peptide methionine sulfoxide reductase MsrA [termite gut metagenome]|uniref:peptide-methionine (S)-S-oxide reductase n=1 Tax=termite gut metagenome TaxID=433724 RepID=A0A5J4QWR2_9ZZZZ
MTQKKALTGTEDTRKNTDFIPTGEGKTETAIFAGGCFWGVEYYMQRIPGVLTVESGYIGGSIDDPTYEEVRKQGTGHAEAVRICFDPTKTNYETLAKTFFEIHDPTQEDGQGPDLGHQYRSEVFYTTSEQKEIAEKLISLLQKKGYAVVTALTPATTFWKAEDYHQNYYNRKGTIPYCHGYTKRFD